MPRSRRARFAPVHNAPRRPSSTTFQTFVPVAGFTELPEISAALGSTTSAQNFWTRQGRLTPRDRLEDLADNVLSDTPTGAFQYEDIDGTRYPVVASSETFAYLSETSYIGLTYVSTASDFPPNGSLQGNVYGTSAYLPRRDLNLGLWTNGEDPVYAWGGPSDNTGFSVLTEGPICKDLTQFNNRTVFWNLRELSSVSRFVTRVGWTVAGDPEDSTGIGSGTDDLVDMRGEGTRIFTVGDEMLLLSTAEAWRGRAVGAPFIHAFSPIDRTTGAPFPRAVLQIGPKGNDAVFWLGADFNIYQFAVGRVVPIGDAIQETLKTNLVNPERAFFGYHEADQILNLYYVRSGSEAPQHGFSFMLKDQTWMPTQYAIPLQRAFTVQQGSLATTWNELEGNLSEQSQTYDELLGKGSEHIPAVLSSNGTTYTYSNSVTSDSNQTMLASADFPVLTGDPTTTRIVDQLRVDHTSAGSSTVTFRLSGDAGDSFVSNTVMTVGSTPNSRQSKFHGQVPGNPHILRIETENPDDLTINRVTVRARNIGGQR